jgi:hypothetical protein
LREGSGIAIVRTVTGDVAADELGPTTMHEHIFGDFTVWQEDPKQTASLAAVAVDPNARVEMGILGVIHRNPVVIRDNLRIGDADERANGKRAKPAQAGWLTRCNARSASRSSAPVSGSAGSTAAGAMSC